MTAGQFRLGMRRPGQDLGHAAAVPAFVFIEGHEAKKSNGPGHLRAAFRATDLEARHSLLVGNLMAAGGADAGTARPESLSSHSSEAPAPS